MFTEIDHEPWQARHSELTEYSNKIFQKSRVDQLQIPSKKQRENKALLINYEESFGNSKQMATDGMESRLGSEMGLTCKHEFQSWTCVAVMKIQPPLKVNRE